MKRRPCVVDGWCPLCYSGRRGRKAYKGHYGYRPPRKGIANVAIERRKAAAPSKSAAADCAGDMLCADFPQLWEWLSCGVYADGGVRTLPTCTVFFDPTAGVRLSLSDRDQGLVAFITAGGLFAALQAAEKGLRDQSLDWRPSKPLGGPTKPVRRP